MENLKNVQNAKEKNISFHYIVPKFNTFLKKGIDLWKKIAYGEGAKKSKKN